MALEEAAADGAVEEEGKVRNEVPKSRLHIWVLFGLLDCRYVKASEEGKGVLVHEFEALEVLQAEVEEGAALGHGDVLEACLVDLGLRFFGLGNFLLDFSGSLL